MPTLQFKGKTVIETYHHTVPHHRLELVPELSVLGKGEKPSLEGNLIIEGDNLLPLKALLPTHAGRDEGWVSMTTLMEPQFKAWIGHTVGRRARGRLPPRQVML